jgi:hypothetical protein
MQDAVNDLDGRDTCGVDGEMRAAIVGKPAGKAIFRRLGGGKQRTYRRVLTGF